MHLDYWLHGGVRTWRAARRGDYQAKVAHVYRVPLRLLRGETRRSDGPPPH